MKPMLINVNAHSAIVFAVPILISPDNKLEQNMAVPCLRSERVSTKPKDQTFCRMPEPLEHVRVVKKRTKRFRRHQSDRFKRVKESWRRPKGIDSAVRRRFNGKTLMPNIGYGSARKTRHMLPSGFFPFLVHNSKDLECLLMHNRRYCAVIAHSVSARKRAAIVKRAAALDIRVANALGRLEPVES